MAQLSSSLVKKVHPWRGGPYPSAKCDVKKCVARLTEVRGLDALKSTFQHLRIDIDQKFMSALKRRVDSPIDQLDSVEPEVEAALLCLLGGNDAAWDRAHEIGADMVHLWCARATVVEATRALLLNADYDGSGKRSREHKPSGLFPYLGPWRALRGYLAQATEADYQAALAEAKGLAREQLRPMVAYAFSTEVDLVGEAANGALAMSPGFHAIGLLAALDNGPMFARLADHLKCFLGNDYLGIKVGDYLPTAVARLGNDSFQGLRVLAESAGKAGDKRLLAELMSELDHPEVGPWLTARSNDKAFGPAAYAYRSKVAPADLGPAGKCTAPPPSSDGDPSLLSQPPWENRAPKRKPKEWTLKMPSFAEAVHFPVGRREYILANIRSKDAESCRMWMDYYLANPNTGHFPEYLCELNDRKWALRQWNESPAQRWNPYTLRDNSWMSVPERMLAIYAAAALPGILTTLSVAPDVNYAGLGLVESPALATVWAESWATKKKFRKQACAWFTRFPKAAAVGLLPVALGAPGKQRGYCESVLRWMEANGLGDSLRQVASEYQATEGLEEILAYDPLQELPAKMPALPSWFHPAKAEAPRTLSGTSLSPTAVANLALMVAISTLETPYAGLAQTDCDPASLEQFAWSVYQQWLQAGGPAKEDWGFRILAYLGGDEAARRLAPELRRWPAEGLSSRASVGLDLLRYIGSDVALTHLHGIALKVRFKALQDKAQQHIQEIAETRGLSVDELADRLVPDLDLDANGTRQLGDYRIRFDELLRPYLLDSGDKVLADIPKSAPAEVQKDWKAFKKDIKTVAAVQLERLEQALTGGRRWSAPTFQRLLVAHPLLGHVVRRLVWGIYDEGRLLRTFRVAEDGSFAGIGDDTVAIEGVVGIYHPVEDAEQVDGWKVVFDDYDILQPFPQLLRSVHRLPSGQSGRELTSYQGLEIPGGHLLSLERRGWHRGECESGCLLEMQRGGLSLQLDEGLALESIAGSTVILGKITSQTALEELSAVALSELLRDMHHLSQKALNKV
jgi:hypothetical protein